MQKTPKMPKKSYGPTNGHSGLESRVHATKNSVRFRLCFHTWMTVFFFEDAFDLNDVDDSSCFLCDQSFGGFYLCHLLIASSLLFKRVCPSIHLDIRL